MKKFIYLLMLIPLAFASCEEEQSSADSLISVDAKGKLVSDLNWDMEGCAGDTRDLIAGQNMIVGSVSVSVDEATDEYVITYSVTEGEWCLTEVHVEVVDEPKYFPVGNSGNPKIGNFEYNQSLDCSTGHEVRIPTSEGTWIAAHGVVECSSNSPEAILATLPETADFCTGVQGPDSYLNISIGEGPIAGDYQAWCIDNDKAISIETCYNGVSVYASTGELPEGAFEQPENFDKVNFLLNSQIVGSECPSGGFYTYGDLQLAIWELLDDTSTGSIAGLGDYSDECVTDLLLFAEAGEGFVPSCGEYVGVIVDRDDIQPLIIPFPLECSPCDETVWADGCDFPGNSWAMYFEYASE